MKQFTAALFLIIFYALFNLGFAQKKRGESLQINFSQSDSTFSFEGPWKFNIGDNPAWANVNYIDSSWKQLNIQEIRKIKTPFWIRAWVKPARHFSNRNVIPHFYYLGQSTIFINNRRIQDDTTPKTLIRNVLFRTPTFVAGDSVLIAARVSPSGEKISLVPRISFDLYDHKLKQDISLLGIITGFLIFISTTLLVLGFLHLLLFLYYREEKSNLFLSLFCLIIGSFFLVGVFLLYYEKKDHLLEVNRVLQEIFPFIAVFLLGLFDTIFYGRLRKVFWIFFALMIIVTALSFFTSDFSALIVLAIIVEIVRVIIVALRKKKPGSRIIGLGFLITLAAIAAVIMIAASVLSKQNENSLSLVAVAILSCLSIFILSIPLTMSFHFASNFSKTNRHLQIQIKQVQDLSHKTIEQEKEKKKILEGQKELLEKQVYERTAEVSFQKKQLEEKNKSITDSINYAQRIQSAILPDERLIQKSFSDAFVLFLPKDIVSGDFYWFHNTSSAPEERGVSFLAVADCTGHGVPGAFMSMIGNTMLNEIVINNRIHQPSAILTQLHSRVSNTLQQRHDASSNDGMDIAFISVNHSEQQLAYSGAMRPLYLIRNKNLIEIKADKFPIGGLKDAPRKFSNNLLQLTSDDSVYLFSDGYADQFGGGKDKKFMVKKFQKLLLDICHLPMADQKEVIHLAHKEWKKDLEQVDDILVVGLRM